ncbi:phytanoyl-CoA dioxygenase family protein [Polyangium aurulentum]|uniref:phytanoyl-CoA dioxygenase family protein n=1 Tax=Polyangium aurulentum TaxID=2567896 RepID=UPI00200C31A4|nr:phytanoyl-CoA dioxygenase family protein [Polyangium aurulentum]UQA55961.1 phytanoyl-CoA dioxygenase family protein [Polyangium aurulentum]
MTTTIETSTASSAAGSAALPPMNRCIQMPSFELGERLTPEQTEFLDTFGFIRFRQFLPRAEVKKLVEEVEEIDARLVAEGRTTINGVPLIMGKRKDGRGFIQRMCFASLFGERLHRFLQDPRFNAILAIAGPGYRIGERERDGLVINHYRREEGSAYKRLGWHTDSLRDLFYLEMPRRYLNVGFYLDDSPIEKGGVRLIPFSHNQGLWPMLTRKAHFLDTDGDPGEYALVAEAGDLTIHDGRIWHRVAEASATGDASQRRVMYVPLMEGPLKPKDESSPTPLYFRLRRFARF